VDAVREIAMILGCPLLRTSSFFRTEPCYALRRTLFISSMSSSAQVASGASSTRAFESSASGVRPQYVRGVEPRSTVKRKIVIYIGYNGAKYHGFQRNEGVETVSDVLERALHRAGAISNENMGSLSKISWVVSARTDKGVSAAGNALSFKSAFPRSSPAPDEERLSLDFETFVRNVNAALPAEIRVFGASKPTGSFSAKDACAGRHYEYLLPLDALSGDRSLEAYATVLNQFRGSHYFHNFTTGNEHKTPPPPQVRQLRLHQPLWR
jgi:tRNA pseudouridine(38-40) synthase